MSSTRLELTWPNKDKFLLVPKDDEGKPVWVERDHPAAAEVRIYDFDGEVGEVDDRNPYADNLLFTGDSLDVLRILSEVPEFRREYRGKVKLIYIDPPFNTGQTFTHYDDWMEHSTWLSFMRDRLLLMKELLSPDGSIWVHLDDVEQHRMQCLLDEVFGESNRIENVTLQSNPKGRQLSRFFATSHETLLIYANNSRDVALVCGSAEEVDLQDFPLREGGTPYRHLPLRNTNKKFNPSTRPNLYYPMFATADGSVFTHDVEGATEILPVFGDGSPAVWRWGKPKASEERHLLVAKMVRGQLGDRIDVFQKDFADESRIKKFQSIWLSEAVGSGDVGRSESVQLFGSGSPFATPKPERLIQRITGIATNPGDIVLDVFGGSGTTAAVAHKMGRRWVTAEILPQTVAEFAQPRLEKVVAGEDPGGITDSVGWSGGGGFRTVTVGPSMYEQAEFGVLLADWATNGRFARAVAGQLGFEWQSKASAPFCGVRGRMRLAVFDGAVGEEEVRQVVAALGEKERVTIVAKSVLPGAEALLTELSRGSKIRKAPRDVLAPARSRRSRKEGAS